MECLLTDFKWYVYGESNQKVKVLLQFCAPPFCWSLSIDCLMLQISWVVEMLVSPKVPVFKYQEMALWVPKQKTEAIFYANHPPKWWKRHRFWVFTTFWWVFSQSFNSAYFELFLDRFSCNTDKKTKGAQNTQRSAQIKKLKKTNQL